ncbi:MAG: Chorismate mutase type, partial [Gaiellaceae bacterium]|nr:Chorismate mutase type [Gaiellaceae bacterium]
MDAPVDLSDLRGRISALDRELLERLNRRLELVAQVQERKQEAGARQIDAKREAELLHELAAANGGPLSEEAVRSLFSAVLDVMKQELQGEPRQDAAQQSRPALPPALHTIAVIGTGLLGASVALAAKRAGVAEVRGFDAEAATLREAKDAGAVDHVASSLADAVAG